MFPKSQASRAVNYKSKKGQEEDSLTDLSDRLALNLKTKVREINPAALFSAPWENLVHVLASIASLLGMEAHLAESKEEPFWEGEQIALKYLMEDLKLNICLKLLDEYKIEQLSIMQREETPENKNLCEQYEKSLCKIVEISVSHTEIVQVLELTLLLSFIKEVLSAAVSQPETLGDDLNGFAESSCIVMLEMVMQNCEEIGESKIVSKIRQHDIFSLLIQHVNTNHSKLSQRHLESALKTLSYIVDTEDFAIHQESYVKDDDDVVGLLLLNPLVQTLQDIKLKSKYRPIVDLIKHHERRSKK